MDLNTEGLIKDLKTVAGDAGERVTDAAKAAEAEALRTARHLNRQVHDNAWAAIGIAACVGLVAGVLLARK